MQKTLIIIEEKYVYILKADEENKKYFLTLEDRNENNYKKVYEMEISEDVYLVYKQTKSIDKKQKNEFDRHIEHSEILENTLNERTLNKQIDMEEEVINNCAFEELREAINELSEPQKGRIIKYYFENKTFQQIAQEENCNRSAVKFSVDAAIRNIYKKLTNNAKPQA